MAAKPNTSRYAVLGVLSLGPMTGYDIKKVIEGSIAHFWSESYGQIYPILRTLAAERLAEQRTERQRGKPDRRIYSLTTEGREELRRWLAVPARVETFRSELLLKLFLGGAADVAASVAQVVHFRAHQQVLHRTYGELERRLRHDMASHPELPFWLMTLDFGQQRNRALLAWSDRTLKTLARLRTRRRRARR
ncbi:MAG TPA: PadR family transcriptional regulator [Methylomirabilota bacterium]|jgi:DNA-binding PadR family transcriptional regulator|nr:PadR family transcriptional regulator [Methylomirabilota bacterium]